MEILVAKWMVNDVIPWSRRAGLSLDEMALTPQILAVLARSVDGGYLSHHHGREFVRELASRRGT